MNGSDKLFLWFMGFLIVPLAIAGTGAIYANHCETLAAINAGLHQEVVEGIAVWVKPRVEQCRCKKPGIGEGLGP